MLIKTLKAYREHLLKAPSRITTSNIDRISRSFSNKSAAFWATRRAELELIERSIKHGEATINKIHSELRLILESGKITYPPSLKGVGFEENLDFKTKKHILGLRSFEPNYTEHQREYLRFMKNAQSNGSKSTWKWRIANHAEEYQAKGWYPFFVTLTVDQNRHDSEKLWKDGRAFRKYIRKLSKVVTHELGVRPAHKTNTPESEYINYIGVIEHGKSREHHHAHILIWMREIPSQWKRCPNRNVGNPHARTQRENKAMQKYWKYSLPGLSPSLYFRSVGDIWGKLGFVVPLSKGKPLPMGTPRQTGGYLMKYFQKEHKEWNHRIKATRNLGKIQLINKIRAMSDSNIQALTWRPTTNNLNHSLKMTHTVPLALLRQLAKQEHYYRSFRRNQQDFKTLTKKSFNTFQKMLQSVRDGDRPERMPSAQYYDWVSQFLPEDSEYSEQKLIEAHQLLSIDFPIENNRNRRISIPANRT